MSLRLSAIIKLSAVRLWIILRCFLSSFFFFLNFTLSCVSFPSVQVVCSSETLIRSTLPFVWQSSCTTPVRTPRKPRSTWCLTWTTSRRPTASPLPMPVSHPHGFVLSLCIVGVFDHTKRGKRGFLYSKGCEMGGDVRTHVFPRFLDDVGFLLKDNSVL